MARSLSTFLVQFETHRHRTGTAPRTLENYHQTLQHLIDFLHSHSIETLDAVTPEVLRDYQTEFIAGVGGDGRSLSPGSQTNVLARIRKFFQFLVKEGYALIDPSRFLEGPRYIVRPPHGVPTLAMVKQLLEAPNTQTPLGLRDRAMIELLYSTGLRVTELADLDVDDIDLGEGELTIRHGKGDKSRRIPVGTAACLWIQRYMDGPRADCPKRNNENALFLSRRGRRLHRIVVARILREHAQAAGLKFPISPHRLRHAFATHMLRNRASLRHLQEMLGHEKLSTTQIYTKVDITDLKEVHRRCHPRGRR